MARPLRMIGWKAWCDDGVVYSSRTHRWPQVPKIGVQVLCVYHAKPYRTYTYGEDVYHLPGRKSVKLGRWMSDDDFAAVVAKAHSDEEWP